MKSCLFFLYGRITKKRSAYFTDLCSVFVLSIILVIVSLVLFACLQLEAWSEVSAICKEKNHLLLVDMAYQGFATGNLDRDAAGLRLLASQGHKLLLCQSFSKNMGLYGESNEGGRERGRERK